MISRVLIFFFAAALAGSAACGAQTTEAEISAKLMGKPLYLRGMWAEDKLKFDAKGSPLKNYGSVSPAMSGFEAKKVSLHGDSLQVEGVRMWLTSEPGDHGAKIVRVPAQNENGSKKPKKVTVEIDGVAGGDFGPTLDAVFSDGLAPMAASVPFAWRAFARTQVDPASGEPARKFRGLRCEAEPVFPKSEEEAKSACPVTVRPIGRKSDVKAPRLLGSEEPRFSELARRSKFSGHVKVYLIVDETGAPTNVQIVQPAGAGLDEEALRAVSNYKFRPATLDGQPVPVDLNVDVNFQIF